MLRVRVPGVSREVQIQTLIFSRQGSGHGKDHRLSLTALGDRRYGIRTRSLDKDGVLA